MIALHCDRDGCDSWQRTDSTFPPFITVTEGNDLLGHFCCLDCLMHWSAIHSTPTQVL